MKKNCACFFAMITSLLGISQSLSSRIASGVKELIADPRLKHASVSVVIAEGKTGKTVYAYQPHLGLAPASTQKIFTSIAAFELLSPQFRYATTLECDSMESGVVKGSLFVRSAGDPTLGSWRWPDTRDSIILEKWAQSLKQQGVRSIEGGLVVVENNYSTQAIPDGWIWQDLGNYYGAGSFALNWKENQYDVILQSGSQINGPVKIVSALPFQSADYTNELRSAAKGTGDNAYIYLPFGDRNFLLSGTIPVEEKSFSISGSVSDPSQWFFSDLHRLLSRNDISFRGDLRKQDTLASGRRVVATHYSPTLDSLNYWFMKKSINLYGEALVKTIAYETGEKASTESGLKQIRNFWQANGISSDELGMIDGSGLSPQNRVTALSLVKALRYARTRPWYKSFYKSFPTFNGMNLKSGSIGGARAYAGYHRSKEGIDYVMAIMVNNYSGPSSYVVRKMFAILDHLK